METGKGPPGPGGGSEEVREEEVLRVLFEQAGEAMVVTEMGSARIRECNSRMAEIHGYSREELIGRSLADLVGDPDPERFLQEIEQALERTGSYSSARAIHRRKDGTLFPCELNIRLVKAGGRRFTIGILRDLTERERAAEFFRVLFEKAPDGAFLVRDEGLRIVEVNEVLCRMLGYTREELLSLSVQEITPPPYRNRIPQVREQVRAGSFDRARRTLLRKDGEEILTDHMISRMEFGGRIYYLAMVRDITEQARVERQLEESRMLLARFRDEAPDPMYELDGEGRFRYVNASGLKMLGRSAGEVLGMPFMEITPPDRRELHREMFGRALRGEVVRFRSEVLGAGGERIPVEIHGGPLEVGGRPGTMGVARLIGEQVRMERELQEEREFLEHVMEEGGDGFVITDDRGLVLRVNRRAVELLSIPRDQLVGRGFLELAEPENRDGLIDCFRRLRRGEAVRLEVRHQRDPRGERILDVSASLLQRGGQRYVFAILRDMSERVRAEEDLRRAHTRLQEEVAVRVQAEKELRLYREIFARANDAILLVDPEGKILEQNEAHRRLLGYSDEDLIGKTPALFAPSYRENMEIVQREGHLRREIVNRTRGGKDLTVEMSLFPVRDEAGRIRCFVAIKRDVTERKQAEAALRESEERWQQLVRNALDQIVTFDRQGRILFINRILEGWDPREVVGVPIFRFILPEFHATVRERMNRLFERGESQTLEIRSLGERRVPAWNLVRVSPLRRGQEIVAGLAIISDISGRKREEERAAARHAVARILAESPPVSETLSRILQAVGEALGWKAGVFWKVDREAGVLRVGEVWIGTPGCPEEAVRELRRRVLRPGEWLPGRAWASQAPVWVVDLVDDPDGTLAAAAGYHGALAFPVGGRGGEIHGVLEFLDRELREPDPAMLELGETLGVQISQFIERQRAEEDLRFQKALLESQSEASVDGILVVSTAGKVASFNRRFQSMWDLDPALLHRGPAEEVWKVLESRLADPRSLQDRRRLGTSTPELEDGGELGLRDGRTFECHTAPVLGSEGVEYGRVYFFRDITGRKRSEEGLRRAVEDARRAYEELKQAQAQLIRSEKLASIGMLVSGVAHQINNPLNVIYGNLRLLREKGCGRGDGRRIPDRVRKMIEDALRGAEQARRIIEDFRNFARDTGTADLVDVNGGLSDTLKVLGRQLPVGVKVVRKLGRVPPIRGFRGQINQVFFNLIQNAVEAVGNKGQIMVSTRCHRGQVVIEIADTGSGIPKHLRKKIFEPFFTTKPPGKGMGLGLSISATIVNNHGGRIEALNRPGGGAIFRVVLPVPPEFRGSKK